MDKNNEIKLIEKFTSLGFYDSANKDEQKNRRGTPERIQSLLQSKEINQKYPSQLKVGNDDSFSLGPTLKKSSDLGLSALSGEIRISNMKKRATNISLKEPGVNLEKVEEENNVDGWKQSARKHY